MKKLLSSFFIVPRGILASATPSTLAGVSLLFFLCIGCTPTVTIDKSNVDILMDQFEEGMIVFADPDIWNNSIDAAEQLHELVVAENWAGLAKLTIEVNTEDDIDWYYLGLSAEKLGYKDAAKRYYGFVHIVSIKFCDPSSGYVDDVCFGIQLPRDSDARLQALSSQD